jgi:hypothetical protein
MPNKIFLIFNTLFGGAGPSHRIGRAAGQVWRFAIPVGRQVVDDRERMFSREPC